MTSHRQAAEQLLEGVHVKGRTRGGLTGAGRKYEREEAMVLLTLALGHALLALEERAEEIAELLKETKETT